MASSSKAAEKARVAKIAGLTLALGLGAGWMLARTPGVGVWIDVEGRAAFEVSCDGAVYASDGETLGIATGNGTCTVAFDASDGVVSRGTIDTSRPARYLCTTTQAPEGELACSER